jgi:glycosyltransferase involved in cell wall biosynthesis
MARTYSARSYPVDHPVVPRRSLAFLPQLASNMILSDLPLAVTRYRSSVLRETVAGLMAREKFDAVVTDFVASAVNMPSVRGTVLFQHNVETTILERHAEHAKNPLERVFYEGQASRMRRYEERACRESAHVIAVSPIDAQRMRDMFGITNVSDVPTGVDVESLRNTGPRSPDTDLVFVGSMDWLPNIDGMLWFTSEILPLIRKAKPDCTVKIVGRRPDQRIKDLAANDPKITVTGTVDDIRPHLWQSRVAILPLRIGGGTRMKVYESMAAGVPMVSTSVGMEGLASIPGEHIIVADTPDAFAAECIRTLGDAALQKRIADAAFTLVDRECSHEAVARQFEKVLENVASRSYQATP